MHKSFAIPMIAAFALAACGSDADTTEAEGEAMALEDVASEMDNAQMPVPGQYRSTAELLEMDMPGANQQMMDMMRAAFAEGAMEENTYCITEEQAANGREEMLAGMAESDCTVTRFDVTGDTIEGAMSCPSGQGISGDVTITGTMDSTSSDMVMSFTTAVPQMGDVGMRMRVVSERIGDCS